MQPGPTLALLAALAAAGGIWCASRYEIAGIRREADIAAKTASAEQRLLAETHAAQQKKQQEEITTLRQQLAEALEAAKPPPTPDEVAVRVLATRELAFRRTPQWKASSVEEITKKLSERAVTGLSPEEAEARSRAALAMGFVPSAFDYREAMAGIAAMKPGGFYEAESGKFYYQADASLARADSREVFAGALLPVLLGQNFADITPPPPADNDDMSLANQALAFGDANFARVRFSISDQSNANFDKGQPPAPPQASPNAPQYFTEAWKWSEDAGNLFVQSIHSKGGLAAVNEAYRRPPQSSAEVMHPEKLYLATPPFQPVRVDFPDTSVNGIAPLHTNVAGELGSMFLIRIFADLDYAAAASEGWAGDRYIVWPGSKEFGDHLLWRSVWMTDADAKEFFAAMRRGVMTRHLIPWQKEFDPSPDEFRIDEPHRVIRIVRNNKTVSLLSATDPAFAKAAADKFLAAP